LLIPELKKWMTGVGQAKNSSLKIEPLASPDRNIMKRETFLQKIQRWSLTPSPKITEPDQRRQAGLLSALLLLLMVTGALVEVLTVLTINRPHYTGYWNTIVAICLMAVVYALSRTQHIRLAYSLAVVLVIAAVFLTGWSQPFGVLGGLLDYLVLPLWLGSIYLTSRELGLVLGIEILGLLLFPLITPKVSISFILTGPFSFLFLTSMLLIVVTRHRDLIEQDRRADLVEREKQSRRQAARAEALLRVAARLNAQLDLETLLDAICEEVARALNTPVSLIALYDEKESAFFSSTAKGIRHDLIRGMESFPKTLYDETIQEFGTVFATPDLRVFSRLPNLPLLKELNLRSMAFATMKYEQELIGTLTAITAGESRSFTEDELLLLQGLADQAALAINNTRLYKDAHRRLEHLQALRAIDIAISSNHNLQDTLNVVLEQITQQLQVDAAAILILDEAKQKLEFGRSRGFLTSSLQYTSLSIGQGLAGRAVQQRQTVHVADLQLDLQTLANATSLSKEGFVSYFATPLISQGQVKGVLEIFHRSPLTPDEEWLGFLETLAGQAAIAIENTTLFEDLQRTNDELLKAYDATIEGWSHALDLRDHETEGHTQRVTELTLELARAYGFSGRDLIYIRWGALLHDIGKMGVPDRILLKEGPLTEDEWKIMWQHPVYAHEMLRTIQYLRPALDIPYCHHEKWDGSGYPRGLKGEEIPLLARLFAVVDVWDALTSQRPYRAAWSPEKTLAHIRAGSGQHFDPHVVEVFEEVIEEEDYPLPHPP
jgi:putative nucleotidyltransferase with HDIG domain